MIYKIKILKTVFIEADSQEEAEDLVFDGCTICEDEAIIKTQLSSLDEMSRTFWIGEEINEQNI